MRRTAGNGAGAEAGTDTGASGQQAACDARDGAKCCLRLGLVALCRPHARVELLRLRTFQYQQRVVALGTKSKR